ncbi:MAG: hypothetical protein NTZ03_09685 [Actinobacteria bacterium]|nr:hypothetical protein [Actinomycetota bacterium]
MNTTSRTARIVAVAGAAALVAVALAGCSSSSSSGSSSSSSSSASSSAIGGNVLPPVMVEPGATTATAKVGDTIVFNQPNPAKTKISTDNSDVLEVMQGKDDGSAQFNPGAKALKAGNATVTIVAADGTTSTVAVTVTG